MSQIWPGPDPARICGIRDRNGSWPVFAIVINKVSVSNTSSIPV